MPEATQKPITPIIHLNGTAKDDLLELRCAVLNHLFDADKALAAMGPNGRDYYPEPGRMQLAEEQHRRRQERLKSLIDDIGAEVEAIMYGE